MPIRILVLDRFVIMKLIAPADLRKFPVDAVIGPFERDECKHEGARATNSQIQSVFTKHCGHLSD
jgi:hypothetical protein